MQQCCIKVLYWIKIKIIMDTQKFICAFLMVCTLCIIPSCSPDDELPEEEEVITEVIWTLTPQGGGEVVTFTFLDADGEGGNDPVVTGGNLVANTTYDGSITLSNTIESPAEDITSEVAAEDKEHQFFFSTTIAGLTIAYADADGDSNPVGLENTVTTTDAGQGTLSLVLRHEPDKNAAGVSDGDITNAGGETDIEVTFDVEVQ